MEIKKRYSLIVITLIFQSVSLYCQTSNDTILVESNVCYIFKAKVIKDISCINTPSNLKVITIDMDSVFYFNDTILFRNVDEFRRIKYLYYYLPVRNHVDIHEGEYYYFLGITDYNKTILWISMISQKNNILYKEVEPPSIYCTEFSYGRIYKLRKLKMFYYKYLLKKPIQFSNLSHSNKYRIKIRVPDYIKCIEEYEGTEIYR
jgi:hypothetical protein